MKEGISVAQVGLDQGRHLKKSGKIILLTRLVQRLMTKENGENLKGKVQKNFHQSKPILLKAQPCGLAYIVTSVKLAACRVWLKLCLYNSKIPSWKVKESINTLFFFSPKRCRTTGSVTFFSLNWLKQPVVLVLQKQGPWDLFEGFFFLFAFKCSFVDFFFFPTFTWNSSTVPWTFENIMQGFPWISGLLN